MGSTEVPKFSSPGYNFDYSVGSNVEGGSDLLSQAKKLLESRGLPDFIRKRREEQGLGSLAAARKSGLADMRGALGNGAALAEGFAGINKNLTEGTKDLYNSLAEGDYSAMKSDRAEGFGNITSLIQLANSIAGSKNQLRGDMSSRVNDYNMTKYQIDESNRFKFGDLLGGLVNAGGQIGGGMAAKGACCFIFMEAFNGRMPWWVRSCRDEFAPESSARRQGYIRMSRWLVPMMHEKGKSEKAKITAGLTRAIVNVLMIKPLTMWGGYYKKARGYRNGWIWKPFVNFWFRYWEVSGAAYG